MAHGPLNSRVGWFNRRANTAFAACSAGSPAGQTASRDADGAAFQDTLSGMGTGQQQRFDHLRGLDPVRYELPMPVGSAFLPASNYQTRLSCSWTANAPTWCPPLSAANRIYHCMQESAALALRDCVRGISGGGAKRLRSSFRLGFPAGPRPRHARCCELGPWQRYLSPGRSFQRPCA